MRKYFGTDGIRGEANIELTVDVAMKLGYALGYYLQKNNPQKKIRIILGTDTRRSGYMLKSALFASLTSLGVNIDFLGVIPTPGVAYLTRRSNADAGIMISASHNKAADNGIKIFGSTGYKLPDEDELEIEGYMDKVDEIIKNPLPGDKVGRYTYREDDYYLYSEHLLSTIDINLKGMKIILDVANGAAYRIASRVFNALGAELVVINNIPNGHNINEKCGSTDMTILKEVVKIYKADIGIAFDGDADRMLAVDNYGNEVDGDKIIGLIAKEWKKENKLNSNRVATTVMSNMGFEEYLDKQEISLIRANVGDRYVLEKMKSHGLNLGGEQSGHIIMLDYNTTGDGVLSAIQLCNTIVKSGKSLNELVKDIKSWPQETVNVLVSNVKKRTWDKNEKIMNVIAECEKELSKKGRILVRASGTEPKIRVMVEADDDNVIHNIIEKIIKEIKKELS